MPTTNANGNSSGAAVVGGRTIQTGGEVAQVRTPADNLSGGEPREAIEKTAVSVQNEYVAHYLVTPPEVEVKPETGGTVPVLESREVRTETFADIGGDRRPNGSSSNLGEGKFTIEFTGGVDFGGLSASAEEFIKDNKDAWIKEVGDMIFSAIEENNRKMANYDQFGMNNSGSYTFSDGSSFG